MVTRRNESGEQLSYGSFTLTEHQRTAVAKIANEPSRAALIADDVGAGKTILALAAAKAVGARTVLVACPLSTFDGWAATAREGGWPVFEITAKNYRAIDRLLAGEEGVYLIGHTFMHLAVKRQTVVPKVNTDFAVEGLKPKKRLGLGVCELPPQPANATKTRRASVPKWSWAKVNRNLDVCIFDEIHNASNSDTATHKALKAIKPQLLKLGLSATPYGDKFGGIWAVTRWLWPDIIDRSYWRWAAEWATIEYNPFATTKKTVMGEKNPGAFVAQLPCYTRERPPRVPVHTYRAKVSLTPVQAEQYAQMKARSIVWLEENPLVADLPIVQKIRLRQMLLGEVTFNVEGEVDFAPDARSTKADACEAIIKRHPEEPMMFYVDSKKFALYLAARLQRAGYRAEPWTGDQTKEERQATKKRFMEGETQFIVGTISKALGEGTDGLQKACSVEVWINQAFSAVLVEQTKGRLNRRGQEAEHITRYELYVPNSADDEDFERSAKKELAREVTL